VSEVFGDGNGASFHGDRLARIERGRKRGVTCGQLIVLQISVRESPGDLAFTRQQKLVERGHGELL